MRVVLLFVFKVTGVRVVDQRLKYKIFCMIDCFSRRCNKWMLSRCHFSCQNLPQGYTPPFFETFHLLIYCLDWKIFQTKVLILKIPNIFGYYERSSESTPSPSNCKNSPLTKDENLAFGIFNSNGRRYWKIFRTKIIVEKVLNIFCHYEKRSESTPSPSNCKNSPLTKDENLVFGYFNSNGRRWWKSFRIKIIAERVLNIFGHYEGSSGSTPFSSKFKNSSRSMLDNFVFLHFQQKVLKMMKNFLSKNFPSKDGEYF